MNAAMACVPRGWRLQRSAWVIVVVVVIVGVGGCASGRSVEAYCSTFYDEGAKFRDVFLDNEASDPDYDPGAALAALVSAPQQLEIFFDKLDDVAPDDIEPDVAAVRDSLQDGIDAMGSATPGGLLGVAFQQGVIGLMSNASWQHVDSWTKENCGPPPSD